MQTVEDFEQQVKVFQVELAEIRKTNAQTNKENVFLKKYFKDYGPTRFKLIIKEKELA